MRKLKLIFCILLVTVLVTACGTQNTNEVQVEKEVIIMDENMSYTGYISYESALSVAETVVYGKIIDIGESYVKNYGDEEFVIKHYYTPITLEVIELIKGNEELSTVTYEALGAEFDDVIYDYEAFNTLDFKIGDKLLVFLSKNDQDISPQCVISEDENGKATQKALGDNAEADTLLEQVELAKNTYSLMVEEDLTE